MRQIFVANRLKVLPLDGFAQELLHSGGYGFFDVLVSLKSRACNYGCRWELFSWYLLLQDAGGLEPVHHRHIAIHKYYCIPLTAGAATLLLLAPLNHLTNGLFAVVGDVGYAGYSAHLEKCLESVDIELVIIHYKDIRACACRIPRFKRVQKKHAPRPNHRSLVIRDDSRWNPFV